MRSVQISRVFTYCVRTLVRTLGRRPRDSHATALRPACHRLMTDLAMPMTVSVCGYTERVKKREHAGGMEGGKEEAEG